MTSGGCEGYVGSLVCEGYVGSVRIARPMCCDVAVQGALCPYLLTGLVFAWVGRYGARPSLQARLDPGIQP